MVQEALDSTKSAHKRIDRIEKRQDNLDGLTKAFSVMQNEQEHIKTDVGEIKDDVKQLVSKPAKRWDGLIDKGIAVVVGAAIGFLLNGGGFNEKRRRIRFPPKINDDTMSSIVIYSLVFCAGITIAGMVLGAFDHDVSAVVDSTHRVFGTELGICGLMKLYDKGVEQAERRKRKMTAKQAEWECKEELRENENE